MNSYMHPQALLVDGTAAEEHWFLAGIRDQIKSLRTTLIEFPDRPSTRLGWVTKLDSAALAGKLPCAASTPKASI